MISGVIYRVQRSLCTACGVIFTYSWSNLLRSVLSLGKQVDQICYVLTPPCRCPSSTQGAAGHHRAADRRLVLDANSTSLKQRRSVRPGAASRPSLPGQLLPHRPLQGAGAGETSRVQGTGELNPPLHSWSVNSPLSVTGTNSKNTKFHTTQLTSQSFSQARFTTKHLNSPGKSKAIKVSDLPVHTENSRFA